RRVAVGDVDHWKSFGPPELAQYSQIARITVPAVGSRPPKRVLWDVDEHVASTGTPGSPSASPDCIQRLFIRAGIAYRSVGLFALQKIARKDDIEGWRPRRPATRVGKHPDVILFQR